MGACGLASRSCVVDMFPCVLPASATCAGSPSRIASDPTSLHTRTHRCLALMR